LNEELTRASEIGLTKQSKAHAIYGGYGLNQRTEPPGRA
jgi:hypothetical protein